MNIVIIFFLLAALLLFVRQKNIYKAELKAILPSAAGLYEYQKGICRLKEHMGVWKDDRVMDLMLKSNRKYLLPLLLIFSRFKIKYFGYSQFPVVFISSYGNISEVSRRKFSSEKALQELSSLRKNIKEAIDDNNAGQIMHGLANVYRFMYGVNGVEDVSRLQLLTLKKPLNEICEYVKKSDVVNAYIVWRRLERAGLNQMSDMELIVYGAIRLQLEKYIISYAYPLDSMAVYQNMQEFSNKLEVINYCVNSATIQRFKFLKNAGILFVMEILAKGLKYRTIS